MLHRVDRNQRDNYNGALMQQYLRASYLMYDTVEHRKHRAHVFHGEDRIQDLALLTMLFPLKNH